MRQEMLDQVGLMGAQPVPLAAAEEGAVGASGAIGRCAAGS
jgi:hypothetical protein